jgi:F0F1-type ATP synthase epsilon subunit
MAAAVTIPAEMGEMQALKGHISVVGRLKPGKIIVFQNNAIPANFDVEEGFFSVNAEDVSILADKILDK